MTRAPNSYERIIRDLSCFGKKVFLHLQTRQLNCKDCSEYFTEPFYFVDKGATQTNRYEEYIYQSCKGADFQSVSKNEDLDWHTVKRIFNKLSERKLQASDRFSNVKILGIDEFSLKKGHKDFACVLVNLETNCVIDILKDRKKDFLKTYFEAKGKEFCEAIEVLSSDMWEDFTTLTKEVFPNAELVIDRFHFFLHLNKALDSCRKELKKSLFKNLELHQGKLRFALLKPTERLAIKDFEIIDAAFEISLDLKIFYSMKEELRRIFNQKIEISVAFEKVNKWVEQAEIFNNKHLNKFLKTLSNWKTGIMNFFKYRVTNGKVEGKNNKIKMIKRKGF